MEEGRGSQRKRWGRASGDGVMESSQGAPSGSWEEAAGTEDDGGWAKAFGEGPGRTTAEGRVALAAGVDGSSLSGSRACEQS